MDNSRHSSLCYHKPRWSFKPKGGLDMAQHSVTISIAKPVDAVFLFFTMPTNLLKLAPPDLHIELVEGPVILQLGSRVKWKGRRWGVAQTMIQEVTSFEPGKLIVEEQKQGPLAKLIHARHFSASQTGTLIREDIQFEPPGGLLGRLVTADFVRKDLEKLIAFRETKLRELFG